jgi:hypothetical protein
LARSYAIGGLASYWLIERIAAFAWAIFLASAAPTARVREPDVPSLQPVSDGSPAMAITDPANRMFRDFGMTKSSVWTGHPALVPRYAELRAMAVALSHRNPGNP